jgi:hypothetical protein
MPAAVAPVMPPPPPGGGELEMDRVGVGPRPGSGLDPLTGEPSAVSRPWWVSPPMLVLLVLLCGPYGLALMWVNGGYSKQTRARVTAIWAGLVVLIAAGVALTAPGQFMSMVAGSAGLSGIPVGNAPATPIVFPSAPSATQKPSGQPGLVPSPPAISASPGLVPGGPGTIIIPGLTAEPKPAASPEAVAQNPDSEDDEAQHVKVKETDGTGANLRDKPGQTGAVIKTIPEGAVLVVVGEDRQMDGKAWKNVKDESGTVGWMAAELLEPA